MRTLLHGESLVDLLCPDPASGLGDAGAFVPHLGGTVPAIAVAAAQAGADVAVSGVVGADAWGQWIRDRLEAAGAGTERLAVTEQPTPLTFTTTDAAQAATARLHGVPLPQVTDGLDPDGALLLTTDTLATDDERELTLTARNAALEADRPVLVAASFAAYRWETPATAASTSRELVKGAFLVVAGAEEARLLSGEEEPAAAADGLVAMGARHAVVAGADGGAALRGSGLRLDAPGARTALGPLAGAILAQLAATDFYAPAIAAALPRAVAQR